VTTKKIASISGVNPSPRPPLWQTFGYGLHFAKKRHSILHVATYKIEIKKFQPQKSFLTLAKLFTRNHGLESFARVIKLSSS